VARLEELRLAATEDRIEADLRLGRGAELITELTTLVAAHPLRERLVGALMRALSQAGRPAEALTVYDQTRMALADQLGADPSPELSDVHTAILRGQIATVERSAVDPARRTNLRASLTSFIGRDADVGQVRELIGEYRLTTLTGPGGSGKTRLAVEVSRTLLDQMPDGVWLVELAPVADGADLPSVVQAAMGMREQTLIDRGVADDPINRLTAALRTRCAVLVLDNCEHLIGAAATLADRLLSECPRLRILATSREPLGITGEAVLPVEPLALPPSDADQNAAGLLSYDSVRLLVDRARAVRPGFTITDQEAQVVARICRALDGMPLAIELAAARLRTMSATQLADRLDDRFGLLTGGSRTAMPRHQTLRAVVDWSWELLSDAERALLRRLAIFVGGATLEAAEQVCTGDAVDISDVLDLLTALANKSLLVVDPVGAATRYRMLETIRAYGLEQLDAAGEREEIRRAHATYFLELAESAEPYSRRAEQLVWLRRLRADHDNINAAIRGAIAAGDAQTAVRLVATVGWYWWLGGQKAEGIELTVDALRVPGEVDDEARATACAMVAFFATAGVGDIRQAEPWVREAQQLTKGLDQPGPLLRLSALIDAVVQDGYGPGVSARETTERLLADDDPWVRAQVRLARTRMLNAEQREADVRTALVELRTVGERWGTCYSLSILADLVARRRDLRQALDYGEQAIALITEIGTVEDLVLILARQAQLYWLFGDLDTYATTMARAEQAAEHVSWPDALAMLAFFKADLARWSGEVSTARVELARAEATLQHITVDPVFRAFILDSTAYVDVAEGNLAVARARRAEALNVVLGSGDEALISQVLIGVADQAVRQGFPHEAVRLLAASESVGGGPDLSRPDGARVEAAARGALGSDAFTEALRQAREDFAGAQWSELATTEAVRELAAIVLGT
jgi:predicted ATPase